MKDEKISLYQEYVTRLKASPYFIVVDYKGMKVSHFSELRRLLADKAEAQIHVVKNTVFKRAAESVGLTWPLGPFLTGQLAVVTGAHDIAAAAKVLKGFKAEFGKPEFRFGCIGQDQVSAKDLLILADLPSLKELRAKLAGIIMEPARRVVSVVAMPGQQLARVIKARSEKQQ
jgi:large subunit ribosomal protein L10